MIERIKITESIQEAVQGSKRDFARLVKDLASKSLWAVTKKAFYGLDVDTDVDWLDYAGGITTRFPRVPFNHPFFPYDSDDEPQFFVGRPARVLHGGGILFDYDLDTKVLGRNNARLKLNDFTMNQAGVVLERQESTFCVYDPVTGEPRTDFYVVQNTNI